jgi:hypothetical protein
LFGPMQPIREITVDNRESTRRTVIPFEDLVIGSTSSGRGWSVFI